jgi:hypothetical protein
MNQDKVREILEAIELPPAPFSLVFSGKTNKKVNGLYKPAKAEIVIHNSNFDSDNQLIYTAIHEYAHHILFTRRGGLPMPRPHTQEFWALFHELLEKAEGLGLYANVFDTVPEFASLTAEIKERCLAGNGSILLELGRLLVQAEELCRIHHARFEDYVERVLGLPKRTASTAIQAQTLNLDPSLGWDGLSLVASIRDPEARSKAAEALSRGATPLIAKRTAMPPEDEDNDPIETLVAEHRRLERSIASMTERMHRIEEKLHSMGISEDDISL